MYENVINERYNFKMSRVAIAMSGGVDSSAAALILKQQGYECVGITMKLYTENSDSTEVMLADAKSVADKLNIPFYEVDLKDCFCENVIDKFISEYINGRTPNPCVYCNKALKFGELLKKAEELGCDYIATGHYSQILKDEKSGRFLLKKGLDLTKDQSYMLYSLSQKQLSRVLFPLADLNKAEVRKIAEENGLITAHKQDSQDICFIPDGDYASFIDRYTHENPAHKENIGRGFNEGDFIGESGEIFGRHKGIINYTIGQRKGLGLSFPQPMYVTKIDAESNTVTLAENEKLFSKKLTAIDINSVLFEKIPENLRVKAKVRYKHIEQFATVIEVSENEFTLEFDEPQRAITSGQAVVLYTEYGTTVIGGGIIK